ncbi:glutamyl-tRNA reductase [Candidatus Nitrososphaera evergladensis SR1]|uniref:Glutamyl-tRNA reductase n=1 Tax=Candidatus Nitrososphaera evergladensis SR1 TaxID=1459636 RepID=A0A075MVW5_9ARCH|nr:glutamyl-tRNA reductase [Candidatus Nitrososphaera evergladensis]AIF83449.1 glutamyl-tRNA reductase [Candidatus Nitrososphaera evergladensis SR1]
MTAAIKTHDSSHFALPVQVVNARVTYKNAPIHLLEKFTFKDVEAAHRAFVDKAGVDECVILQTCNRVEVFVAAKNADEAKVMGQWAEAAGLEKKDLASVEVSTGKEAVLHLMKLASGLDSLVVGENQILGQVRRAFEYSRANRYANANLAAIFDRALKVGSRVRTATGINKGNVSIASVAVNLADEYFDDLKTKRVMLIGSGEAASLVAKVLKNSGVDFMVTSRTYERARSFSETVAGKPVPFDTALNMLGQLDLIFVASTAPYFLITYERLQEAVKGRKDAVMIFDLSNPRTVDEKVATIHGVKLINMDQIAELVEKNMRSRMKEAHAAEKMIEGEMKSVDGMMKRMKAEPVVVSVFKSVDAIRERELKKALSMLGKKAGSDDNDAKVIEQLSYAIVEGILSTPMNYLRKEIEEGDMESEELMKIVAKMFKYEDEKKQQQQ